jgi:excinuclease UvrABC ATPase subunit
MNAANIELRGLRAGNLKDLDLDLAVGCWTAVHGPSGAGKSALLFGVLEPVSRRRFEVLEDAQCLPGGDESWLQPLADRVEGLTPVIASAGEIPRGRRKTQLLAALDLWDHLSTAWQQDGQYLCLSCQHTWRPPSLADLSSESAGWQENEVVLVLAAAAGLQSVQLLQAGWTRYQLENRLQRLEEAADTMPPGSWLLIDRFKWRAANQTRFQDALQVALGRGEAIRLQVAELHHDFPAAGSCPQCGAIHQSHAWLDWARRTEVTDRVVGGRSLQQWHDAPLRDWLDLSATARAARSTARLQMLSRTGLGHLAPSRTLGTLSLGEARRLEIVAWISQVRRGQTVLLDEPGMGLHGRERQALAGLLHELVGQGNTVLTADPAREFLEAAHRWLALGPEGGPGGGQIMGQGGREELPPEDWQENPTGAALASDFLQFKKLRCRFLDIPKLKVPLGRLVAFCGVSGSGKTTLLEGELLPRLREERDFEGTAPMGGVHVLLERALRWSPVSTVATLAGVWAEVRRAFAESEEGRIRGLSPGDLVARPGHGACHTCAGRALDQHHLPCTACYGLGLREDLLELRLRNRSLAEWLSTPLERLEKRLPGRGRLRATVKMLIALGMGGRTLGERGRFLSLGERGRIALARALSKARPGFPKLFLLDEPCLGLPVSEARRVVELLRSLCQQGHSFWVVEHHEYLLRSADWMLEIGPAAGMDGGQLVFEGLPAQVIGGSTPTGQWLESRRREALQPPPRRTFAPLRSQRIAENVSRSGRLRLEQELARELAMRSPLLNDMLAVQSDSPVENEPSAVEPDWTPVAWPAAPRRGVSVAAVLGLAAPLERTLQDFGRSACKGCGGGGPWSDFVAAAQALGGGREVVLATPLTDDFLQRKEHPQWLTAAGFRRFLSAGQSFRWRREEQQGLQSGDFVWLDRLNPQDGDQVGRLRDVAHHARLLGSGIVVALDPQQLQQQLWSFQQGACRDCGRQDLGLELRLGAMRAADLQTAPLADVLKTCVALETAGQQFQTALEMLNGCGLLPLPGGTSYQSLTLIQQRLARLAGWLLYPVSGVVLLADQPLAGLPPFLAQRFGKLMLEGEGRFRFTDAEGWLEKPPVTTTSMSGFSPAFALQDWCYPGLAKATSLLREALGVEHLLRDYFARTEGARFHGWGSNHFDATRSPLRCPACRGRGFTPVHFEFRIGCPRCHHTGWGREVGKAEDRGIRWLDLGQQSLAELAEFFASHPTLGRIFTVGVELQMGSFRLDESLQRLPLGVRMLAPLAAFLAENTDSEAPLHIGLATAGWNRLEAEQISSRIDRLRPGRIGFERREHHPLFQPL